MFNIAYEVITQPIKYLSLNYVESKYPSTNGYIDPFKMNQERIKVLGVANTLNVLAEAAFLTCVVAPVAEELIFRGAIQFGATWITGSEQLGILISTVLFAQDHCKTNKNPLAFVFPLADCYFIFNPARASGGLLASMAAHSFHNLSRILPFFIQVYFNKNE